MSSFFKSNVGSVYDTKLFFLRYKLRNTNFILFKGSFVQDKHVSILCVGLVNSGFGVQCYIKCSRD